MSFDCQKKTLLISMLSVDVSEYLSHSRSREREELNCDIQNILWYYIDCNVHRKSEIPFSLKMKFNIHIFSAWNICIAHCIYMCCVCDQKISWPICNLALRK